MCIRFKGLCGGGKKLPTLSNPATANEIMSGSEAIDANGEVITGTHVCSGGYTADDIDISVSSTGTVAAYSTTDGVTLVSHTLSSSDDSDFKSSNIKSGVSIFGVSGSYTGTTVETGIKYESIDNYIRDGNLITVFLSETLSNLRGIGFILDFEVSSSRHPWLVVTDHVSIPALEDSDLFAVFCDTNGGYDAAQINIPVTVGYDYIALDITNATDLGILYSTSQEPSISGFVFYD